MHRYINYLPHENDGLIFTKLNSPYKPGTDDTLIKWKPPYLNSIDFLMIPNKKFGGNLINRVIELYTQGDIELAGDKKYNFLINMTIIEKLYTTFLFDFMIVST